MPDAQRFDPTATGWVVRCLPTEHVPSSSWWYGPDHGWGTTSGPLDGSVRVWPTRKAAEEAIRSVYGTAGLASTGKRAERVADAIEVAVEEAEERRDRVLASDRDDRQSIADANDERIAYLRGEENARA